MRRPQSKRTLSGGEASTLLRSSPRKRGSSRQYVSHSVWPWVPACAGTNGFLLCACAIFLGPRLRGDERLGDEASTSPRSSPRKRGSSRQYVSQFVRPWVPACAGTNGFLLCACAILRSSPRKRGSRKMGRSGLGVLGPRLRGDE